MIPTYRLGHVSVLCLSFATHWGSFMGRLPQFAGVVVQYINIALGEDSPPSLASRG
jgi:hypothetical protein